MDMLFLIAFLNMSVCYGCAIFSHISGHILLEAVILILKGKKNIVLGWSDDRCKLAILSLLQLLLTFPVGLQSDKPPWSFPATVLRY